MVNIPLFCTAEDAKPLVPELMNIDEKEDYWLPYFLAESRQGPAEGEQFREHLAEGEDFVNDFLGASIEECGAFELEQQEGNDMMDEDKIVLLDARSARDKTVTFCYYVRAKDANLLPNDKKGDTWYAFRVPYTQVFKLSCYMPPCGDADEDWGVIFHRKEELTDEHGIFDLDRATELCIQGEGYVPGLEDYE
ncbi:hypothetical protein PG993_005467 [Apiospora rasikravindrae]|uniref:Uncharacterized protein n=1 Tax=Apiospora rasikravindrae TaxID=990691 RepID=A0ABR1TFP4_9PEZI